jgi:two-component system cell cycle sensor histidine kinase PleC
VSHELRTPLNAILGYSEILSGEIMGPHAISAYKGYATDIHCSGQHLLSLINDILDLSRIESGRQELKEEPVSIAEIGEDCVKLIRKDAEAKKLRLRLEFDRSLPRLLADRRHINQIWLNLLSNAIKFTPEQGEITVTAGLSADRLFLRVADTGVGIPAHEIDSLRGAFIRGSDAVRSAIEGAGLGLSIVNGLVRLHDGDLSISSEIGKGTEIDVSFPPSRTLSPNKPNAADPQYSASQRKLIAITA